MKLILVITINWALKLFIAWLMYLLATWLQVPEWAMIAMIAVGACETKLIVNGKPLVKSMLGSKFTGRS